MGQECFLRSEDGRHPDISLKEGELFDLGRGPQTKIKDPKCSRCQVQLTVDLAKLTVECVQKGGNPSQLQGGDLLKPGDKKILKHRDEIELLPGEYKYRVIFNPPPQKSKEIEEDIANQEEYPKKPAKRSMEQENGGALKRMCSREDDNNLPWFKVETGRPFRTKERLEWSKCYEGKLIIMTTKDSAPSNKIAAFDIDGTIITTQSGKVFPTDKHDWKLLYSEIPGKLKSLHAEGYRIVFITNQAGISKGKLKVEDFCDKAENIVRKVGVPVLLLCSTAERGFFRKPRPGIWYWLRNTGNGDCSINMEESFYCGDAAGRRVGWMEKKKKDFSCSDRLFALNLDLKFYTPEEYFMRHKPTKLFDLPPFDPTRHLAESLLEPESEKLVASSQEMVMMVGIQGSGKSHVAEMLERKGYVVACNDRSGGKDKSLKICRDALASGKSVVVDNTHRDKDSRKDYIALARNSNVPVRCFKMNTSHDHARHNNSYRELVDPHHVKINEVLFNSYRSKFEEPELGEGYKSIVRVNFIPAFPDSSHEQLYKMHLLEK